MHTEQIEMSTTVLTFLTIGIAVIAGLPANHDIKIIGGVPAERGEFPYIVYIKLDGKTHCGASIINANWIVTAAQCVELSSASGYTLIAGEHDLEKNEGSEQVRKVAKIIPHRDYSSKTFENDIALIQVVEPFTFDDFVQPVNLPSSNFEPNNDLTVAGWGTIDVGDSYPTILQKVTIPIVADDSCNSSYGGGKILPGMLCAGANGKDACLADTGGPLMSNKTLTGLVSWGYGCGSDAYPGVYTEVQHFSTWIKDQIS